MPELRKRRSADREPGNAERTATAVKGYDPDAVHLWMMNDVDCQHLFAFERDGIDTGKRSDEERIYAIREGTWLGYKDAKRILAKMEDLLNYPRITRMPNMLLVAPSFNGKTSILQRFYRCINRSGSD
jgi:hypothetical protein